MLRYTAWVNFMVTILYPRISRRSIQGGRRYPLLCLYISPNMCFLVPVLTMFWSLGLVACILDAGR